ncbi:MAG: Hpt domain-containing protein [Desulfovibrio sp.]
MTDDSTATGISLSGLREAFSGSEDVLVQMLGLFQVQAMERMAQLNAHLAAWDVMAARTALHSLVNISGAVRAYAMSDLAKAVGEAVKREDRGQALAAAEVLGRECSTVLEQVQIMLDASQARPRDIWLAVLPSLQASAPSA